MRLLADMGVSPRIVEYLRAAGHEAVHLREEGLQRLPDMAVFQKAIAEQRVVLTFDLDFSEIAARSGEAFSSVVLFRLTDTRTAFVWQRLQEVLISAGDELRAGAVIVVEDRRIRVRNLPIGTMGRPVDN